MEIADAHLQAATPMGEGMETSAAIYVRRSAMDDREGDNHSLKGKERERREWAEREGLTVVPVYREAWGTSASRFSKKASWSSAKLVI